MGMMRKYELVEIDASTERMPIDQFYKDHVSKSLPAVFRKDIIESELVQAMANIDGKALDDFLIDKFTVDHRQFLEDNIATINGWESKGA